MHLIRGNFPQRQMLVQAKNASDTAFVCSYGQGLSPALQPTRVSGHSLILPRARPPGSSHSRLCPLPILFQPGRGCGSQAKMLPASCQGCSLFSCCFLQGCTAPSFLPAGCVVLEVCQPQTVTQQNPRSPQQGSSKCNSSIPPSLGAITPTLGTT